MKLELYFPTKPAKINQRFGKPATAELAAMYTSLGLAGHNGWDFWAPDGWLIRATHDGTVTFAGEDGSGGYGVVVRTTQEFDYKDDVAFFKTIYWHLQKTGILVKAGQTVKVGDVLGLADNTGMSTGSHLHFGMKPVGQGEADWQWFNLEQNNGYFGAIDPEMYWNGYCAEDASKVASLTKTLTLVAKLTADYPILKAPLTPLFNTLTQSLANLRT